MKAIAPKHFLEIETGGQNVLNAREGDLAGKVAPRKLGLLTEDFL